MDAFFPGSFDPLTSGHLNVLKQAIKIFSNIHILLAENTQKQSFFTKQERLGALEKSFSNEKKITCHQWEGPIVDYAKKFSLSCCIRGLRNGPDFESERSLAAMNSQLYPEMQTIFFPTSYEFAHISSSLVKELFLTGGHVDDYVPEPFLLLFNKKKQGK